MRKALAALWLLVAACSTPPAPSSDAATDAPATCASTADCDDGLFCNGHEQCVPGSAGANRLGCVAGTPTCLTGQSCNEAADTCTTICSATSDADGDTHDAIQCGGDDCDDSDAHRFPGNPEVCDSAAHDEDCDLTTYGSRDVDADTYDDATCCNADTTGVRVCGTDCDDMRATQHPDAPEVCNGIDDDCNGVLDGPSEDSDHDGHANSLCAGSGGSDCNDRYPDVYVGAPELCDGIDSDCSSCDATTQLCTGPGCATPETRCGDPRSDTREDADGDAHAPTGATCTGGFPADDCDDTHAAAHPGGAEICDGIDDDCNGTVDDHAITDAMCLGTTSSASVVCARSAGACVIRTCTAGLSDCDGDPANGCETDTRTSPLHCGECGAACGAAGTCTNGVCDAVTSLDVTTDRACVVRASGGVACWGANSSGLLHDGTMIDRATPVQWVTSGPVASLSLRCCSECVLYADGRAVCASSTLGTTGSGVTQLVDDGLDRARCALFSDGHVGCLGGNAEGELGNGTITASTTLVTPMGLTGSAPGSLAGPVVQLGQGTAMICARFADGRVACWGNGTLVPTLVSLPAPASELAVGGPSACALLPQGTPGGNVVCWGQNGVGQLGDGTTIGRPTPVAVVGITDAINVSQGGFFACATHADGTISCWGQNDYGQLGNGTLVASAVPVSVAGIEDAISVHAGHNAGGADHASTVCAVRVGGAITCWGRGDHGQLGDGSYDAMRTTPGASVFLRSAVPSVGGITTCAHISDGTARCWGVNNQGEIGDGSSDGSTVPRIVSGITDAVAIRTGTAFGTGDSHTCTVHVTGTLTCSGDNSYGELGDGTTMARETEVPVPGITDAVDVVVDSYFTCTLHATGHVDCWGANDVGQLGDGTTTNRSTPGPVMGISNAVQITAGFDTACARLADGGLRCWGRGMEGELGNGTMANSSTPVDVTGLTDVVSIVEGVSNTCALLADGTVSCWGDTTVGIASAPAGLATTPMPVPGLTGVREIAIGDARACARRADGSVWCWGQNSMGAVTPPAAFGGFDDVTRLSGGGEEFCALRADGSLRCWGRNFGGQIGDGTRYDRAAPVQVIGL